MPKTLGLFVLTAIAEIVGCYSVFLWLKAGKSALLIIPALVCLCLFSWLLTLHPSHAGRVYAAYGGVYVAVSILWMWGVEKQMPDWVDLAGVTITLAGMALIAFGPHKN